MIQGQRIDSGYTLVSTATAKALCEGRLPRHGYERITSHEGQRCYVLRTVYWFKRYWSVRGLDASSVQPRRLTPVW